MFILSNYDKEEPFRISKSNNLVVLEAHIPVEGHASTDTPDCITYRATEANHPVQYFCMAHSDERTESFRTEELVPAKMFWVETVYERGSKEAENATFKGLVNDFGDRGARERIKRREIQTTTRKKIAQFNTSNQLLPEHNREASHVRDLYSIENLFQSHILERLREVEPEDVCDLVSHIEITDNNRIFISALDCLYKFLSNKEIKPRTTPPEYRFFYEHIKEDIVHNRIAPLAKDKLIVKFYILLLMVNNYRIPLSQIPRFATLQSKFIVMLKIIGCTMGGSGMVTLSKIPEDASGLRL